jgi:hypothetical protein
MRSAPLLRALGKAFAIVIPPSEPETERDRFCGACARCRMTRSRVPSSPMSRQTVPPMDLSATESKRACAEVTSYRLEPFPLRTCRALHSAFFERGRRSCHGAAERRARTVAMCVRHLRSGRVAQHRDAHHGPICLQPWSRAALTIVWPPLGPHPGGRHSSI